MGLSKAFLNGCYPAIFRLQPIPIECSYELHGFPIGHLAEGQDEVLHTGDLEGTFQAKDTFVSLDIVNPVSQVERTISSVCYRSS